MNRKERIEQYVKQITKETIQSGKLDHSGVDALVISQELHLDRANVSKDLNSLWKEGKLIKIQERPVLFHSCEELTKAFSVNYLPTLIAKGEVLSSFLHPVHSQKTLEQAPTSDTIDLMIGAKDSLSIQVSKAKSAIAYPPSGIHTLLLGKAGVGKWKFALYMLDYAIKHGYKLNDSKIIRVDCKNFDEPHSNFNLHLFGASKGFAGDKIRKGVIEECHEGVIFLDNIQSLHQNFVDLLIELTEKNTYTRVGESIPRPFNCMIIAASTILDTQNPAIYSIAKYLPIHITLPNIDSRSLNEKIEWILYFFAQEAMQTQYPIRFHKDILSCFAVKSYQENLTEMKNEIKLACSKAYLDAQMNQLNVLAIGFQHLSLEIVQSKTDELNEYRVNRILSMLKDDYILIDANGTSETIHYFQNASAMYGLQRMNQFVNEFNTDIETVDNMQSYISDIIICVKNCGNAQLNALESAIHPMVLRLFQQSIQSADILEDFTHHVSSYYGLLLHITNLIKRIETGIYTPIADYASIAERLYPQDYLCAKNIIQAIETQYNCSISRKEIDFIALYLAAAKSWSDLAKPSILLISHGDAIASSMMQHILHVTSSDIKIAAIDYRSELQFNDLLEYASIKAHDLDQGAGIIILTDYEPLLSISDYLRINENIPCRTITPLSLTRIMEVIELINQHFSINQIHQHFEHRMNENNNSVSKESTFIDKLTNQFISTTVSFIDSKKAVDSLMKIMEQICLIFKTPITEELTVKFVCHCVHMLERVIRKEPLQYPKLTNFLNENSQKFHMIEKNFKEVEETFGIKIPSDEFAYITEIFLYMSI